MAIDIVKSDGKPVHLWAPVGEVEDQALAQLRRTASLPWVFHHVAAMPDVHFGIGATVGSVVAMKGAVSPAAVGVDIGCGMGAIETSLLASDLPDNLEALRSAIEAAIPVGFNSHDEPAFKAGMPESIRREGAELFSGFRGLTDRVRDRLGVAQRQVGTLGGGNHFIEICLASDGRVWLMLHSGSRNIGKTLAEVHISAAKKLSHNADLPDRDLAVFLAGTAEMAAYRNDLFWAQGYALFNRRVMFELLCDVVTRVLSPREAAITFEPPILCHHNYVSEETHFGEEVMVTRKGAIRAGLGELGIIPGSMGTKSFIVRGRGNAESFCSASHGAGRRMSRGAAKRTFSLEDLAVQTAGVCCRKDGGVLDEIPGAYKPIEQVMRNQADLVQIVTELKQVLCVKG
jgi:tRNA-splicing ligase RtcB (3'-phosphate/5'-hydroxy nucleic acid ligase)